MDFVHYSATGNTFLIFDDRKCEVSIEDKSKWGLIAEKYNVDGLLFVQESEEFDFTMRYLNRDGGEVEMCGNGARAICTFVYEELNLPLSNNAYQFKTFNGPLTGLKTESGFAINMGTPKDFNMLEVGDLFEGKKSLYAYTGVPHVVYEVDDVEKVDLITCARPIRYNERFENGTNINFYHLDNEKIFMRTYERGVENETLSCGTGTVAVAMAVYKYHHLKSPIHIKAPGGLLTVSWDGDFEEPKLAGPVEVLKKGKLDA